MAAADIARREQAKFQRLEEALRALVLESNADWRVRSLCLALRYRSGSVGEVARRRKTIKRLSFFPVHTTTAKCTDTLQAQPDVQRVLNDASLRR
jgi:hypothetical protein